MEESSLSKVGGGLSWLSRREVLARASAAAAVLERVDLVVELSDFLPGAGGACFTDADDFLAALPRVEPLDLAEAEAEESREAAARCQDRAAMVRMAADAAMKSLEQAAVPPRQQKSIGASVISSQIYLFHHVAGFASQNSRSV